MEICMTDTSSAPCYPLQAFAQLREDLQRTIIGQPHLIDCLLIALLADGHLLVEGALTGQDHRGEGTSLH
jgi:hypothetical protein